MKPKPKPKEKVKSFVSTTSKREKITMSDSGMPIIKRPQRVTILGDVPDEIKLPTEEDNISPYNKWL